MRGNFALEEGYCEDFTDFSELDRLENEYLASKKQHPSAKPTPIPYSKPQKASLPKWKTVKEKYSKKRDTTSNDRQQLTIAGFFGSQEVQPLGNPDGGRQGTNSPIPHPKTKPRKEASSLFDVPNFDNESSEPWWATRMPESDCHTFDPIAGARWIFPVSEARPKRKYQFEIAERALFANTLVCLPTGLGKTLIAAVVMLNFYRWFPKGKIIFLAPTKPLVRQQLDACQGIAGIPKDDMACMTGMTPIQQRSELWTTKRVFFMTGQTLQNDIAEHEICPKEAIVCLVIDEAHRASGKYAYNVVVEELMKASVRFRLLALTATPGSTHDKVQDVINGLKISCLELRSENDPDVKQYTYKRLEELQKVPLSQGTREIEALITEEVKGHIGYLNKYFDGRISLQSHSYMLQTKKTLFERGRSGAGNNQERDEQISRAFANAHFFTSLVETLVVYGIGPAIRKIEENQDNRVKLDSKRMEEVYKRMQRIKEKGFSSAKLEVLQNVLKDHFRKNDVGSTKVIIFSNLRESVMEIVDLLNLQDTSIKAKEFIGQQTGKTKGMSQKRQIQIVEDFKNGDFNVLVCTSIGEEGLDISQVDLVIAYDVMSVGRMTQRMGRTGRQRAGKVDILFFEIISVYSIDA